MTCMASTSWFIRMEPISAAKAEAERPASSTAVITTANSRNSRPTMPPISSSGMNTATSDTLMVSTVKPTSRAPTPMSPAGTSVYSPRWR